MFLEISQNSQENTCAKASFLIKRFSNFNEKETLGTGASKNNFFTEHLRWLFLTGVLNYSENFAKFPRIHSCWSSLLDVCWRPAFLLSEIHHIGILWILHKFQRSFKEHLWRNASTRLLWLWMHCRTFVTFSTVLLTNSVILHSGKLHAGNFFIFFSCCFCFSSNTLVNFSLSFSTSLRSTLAGSTLISGM